MFVLPVIDLKGGVVVRGVAGRRHEYLPIQSQLVDEPSPRAVATAYAERFGFESVYVADLDAIAGAAPDMSSYKEIASCGMVLCLDAGIGNEQQAIRLRDACQLAKLLPRVVIGLESIEGLTALDGIHQAVDPAHTLFSLDLKGGQPLSKWSESDSPSLETLAASVATQVRNRGMHALIVLDLADVGVGQGTSTLGLLRFLHGEFPELKLIAGGGVRGIGDLDRLQEAGCYAALVASALHDGRITPKDLERFSGGPRIA